MKYEQFFNWINEKCVPEIINLKVKMYKLARNTQVELCKLINNTPKELMEEFFKSEIWLDQYRVLVSLDCKKGIGYKEEDSYDETFYTSFDDTSQEILKDILVNFITFIYNNYPKAFEPKHKKLLN